MPTKKVGNWGNECAKGYFQGLFQSEMGKLAADFTDIADLNPIFFNTHL